MKVFISWSGAETKSLAVAKVFDAWLPTVLNAVEPWISSRGLSAGLKWNQQLEKELDDTSFGIIVVTPWNQNSQWLNFEAGALSKRVKGSEARVAPLLIDFPSVANLSGPLSSYQAVEPTKAGVKGLVISINEALGEEARRMDALERAFDVCWPDLERRLQKINDEMKSESSPADAPDPQPVSSVDEGDKFNQILIAIRDLQRSDARLKSTIAAQIPSSSTPTFSNKKQNEVQKRRVRMELKDTLSLFDVTVLGVEITVDGSLHIFTDVKLSEDQEHMVMQNIMTTFPYRSFRFSHQDAIEEEELFPVNI